MKVKCSMAGVSPCPAGKTNKNWQIGYVYCDHAEYHVAETACKVKCKINTKAECVEKIKRRSKIIKRRSK